MSDLVESIFSDMPTVGSKKSSFVRDIDQSDLWVVSYPRKLWTPEHRQTCKKSSLLMVKICSFVLLLPSLFYARTILEIIYSFTTFHRLCFYYYLFLLSNCILFHLLTSYSNLYNFWCWIRNYQKITFFPYFLKEFYLILFYILRLHFTPQNLTIINNIWKWLNLLPLSFTCPEFLSSHFHLFQHFSFRENIIPMTHIKSY